MNGVPRRPTMPTGVDMESFLKFLLYQRPDYMELMRDDLNRQQSPTYPTPQVPRNQIENLLPVRQAAFQQAMSQPPRDYGVADDDTKAYMQWLGTQAIRTDPDGQMFMWREGKWYKIPTLDEWKERPKDWRSKGVRGS